MKKYFLIFCLVNLFLIENSLCMKRKCNEQSIQPTKKICLEVKNTDCEMEYNPEVLFEKLEQNTQIKPENNSEIDDLIDLFNKENFFIENRSQFRKEILSKIIKTSSENDVESIKKDLLDFRL